MCWTSRRAACRRNAQALLPPLFPRSTTPTLPTPPVALTDALQGSGLQLLLGYTDYSVEKEEELIESMLRRRPEAIVVTGGSHTARGRKLLEQSGIPVIETWDLPKSPVQPCCGLFQCRSFGGTGEVSLMARAIGASPSSAAPPIATRVVPTGAQVMRRPLPNWACRKHGHFVRHATDFHEAGWRGHCPAAGAMARS